MTHLGKIVLWTLLSIAATTPLAATEKVVSTRQGRASFYCNSLHGRKTASGERYDKNEFTAAHRRLPFGTRVRVTNLLNRRAVIVTINDRGPFARNRKIDLSRAAARELRLIERGIAPVRVEVLGN